CHRGIGTSCTSLPAGSFRRALGLLTRVTHVAPFVVGNALTVPCCSARHEHSVLTANGKDRPADPITAGQAQELPESKTIVSRTAALVGRQAELDVLEGALRSDAGLVLVTGEAGIGKTRLIAEALTRAREAGSITLSAACLPMAEKLSL